MAARRRPQAPVLERRVLDREPEPGDRHRVGVEERRVLVTADLAADAGLLEDVHALQHERVGQPEIGRHRGQLGRVREALEDRIEIVHGVPDLVDAELLRLAQGAGVVERLLLEEAPRGGAARQELAVAHPFLLLGGEDGALGGRLPLLDELDGALPELGAPLRRLRSLR